MGLLLAPRMGYPSNVVVVGNVYIEESMEDVLARHGGQNEVFLSG
jgi:hypothetical protein